MEFAVIFPKLWVRWASPEGTPDRDFLVRIAALFLLVLPAIVFAQSVQLTPEQQQTLNSLPPAQRAQAEAALRQIQGQDGASQAKAGRESDENAVQRPDLPPEDAESDEFGVHRADAGTRLVITFTPILLPDPAQSKEMAEQLADDPALSRLEGNQLFTLDNAGVLTLPGLGIIPLLGLTREDIERRLSAESYLALFDVSATILDMRPTGAEALEPFGYDMFEPRTSSLDPVITGPVPPDYVLGPGDTVRVQLFGNVNGIYEYEVSRDGILNLPQLGPVTVAGIPFSEFRQDLRNRVQEMLIGTQVSVTMGPLKTIRVFVLGDANRPGSYVVSGLGTISSALYRSGGISEIGSLRKIQLKRGGRTITTLDLYDLLLSGDTSGDSRLLPGDVIFVPPVGTTIGVGGAVKRPAIYEAKNSATVADAVALAGGLTADAFAAGARLERIGKDRERRVVSIDLTSPESRGLNVQAGDILMVPQVLPEFENTVTVAGHVQRPGRHQWFPGMRLTDAISSPSELKPGVDDQYILIRREKVRGRPVQVLSADLGAALRDPSSGENIELESRDTIHIFSLAFGRQRIVTPLMEELKLQSTFDNPFKQVEISGNVRAPGEYPLEPGMTVSDLIRAGGSLNEQAFTLEAELTRYAIVDEQIRQTVLIRFDLGAILRGEQSADFELTAHDHLSITRIQEWESVWSVKLDGEVKFPGEYRIRRGETLTSVLQRAGGLTDEAFREGAIFLRESLREHEREQIDSLIRRLQTDLASLALQSVGTSGAETLQAGQALLDQLRGAEAVGRLVINTDRLAENENVRLSDTIELRDGDQLLVPTRSQVVTVIGETQQNTSHLHIRGLSQDDYIGLSGGLTRRADKSRIYIVRASGSVVTQSRSRWLGRRSHVDVRPGDTIVIPLDADRIRPLTFWTNVTQILYQSAIAVAAVQTFGN